MRLSRIKLAGFKSFVDPTTLQLPGNLTGIVGPNGCGKSNTIDAVRWVMGETSAKHLRGESMDDVIFSGSSARKPVGVASVELVFDNTSGKLGGQYAGYAEISIKRQVSRDGQSQYILNGTRCRRRDITDIFLGTGLGPRSYAIIEQGMISRLIEARPQDMRVYIEEAAGISRYKERRRETENRIRHTRDNLDRLNDLREEVDKQLAHLERQSKQAERYKSLKLEEKQVRAELLGLRWQEYSGAIENFDSRVAECNEQVSVAQEKHDQIDGDIDGFRDQRKQLDGTANEIQARFYSIGADVSRIEQTLSHQQAERDKYDREEKRIAEELIETDQNISSDEQRLQEIDSEMSKAGPGQELAEKQLAEMKQGSEAAEQAFQDWLLQRENIGQQLAEQRQQMELASERAAQLEELGAESQERIARLEQERGELSTSVLGVQIDQQESQRLTLVSEETALTGSLGNATQALGLARERQIAADNELDQMRTEAQAASGRLASLHALQQSALGTDEASRQDWLERHNLADSPRLGQLLNIELGWENAAEAVLGDFLDAVCVEDFDQLGEKLLADADGAFRVLRDNAGDDNSSPQAGLASVLSSTAGIAELLQGVTVCDSLEQALLARDTLQAGESLVTRDGIWLGRHWLCVRKGDEADGVLVRQQEITTLEQELQQLEQQIEKLQEKRRLQEEKVLQSEQQRDKLQALLNARHRDISTLVGQIEASHMQMDQDDKRAQALQFELDDAEAGMARFLRESAEANEQAAEAGASVDNLQAQFDDIETTRATLISRRDESRAGLEQIQLNAQQALVRLESLKSVRESTLQNMQRMKQQKQSLSERQADLAAVARPDGDDSEALGEKLDELLELRESVEDQLASARRELEAHDTQQRSKEQQRNQAQLQLQQAREAVQQVTIESQEARVRLKTIDEQLTEQGVSREALIPQIPAEATVQEWQTRIDDLEKRIQRLGAINLAAIDEHRELQQRKEYLDGQYEDITAALETLEEAISKIDHETKTMFRETFDIVNGKLQELFPRLFGGGQAQLELTGENMLDTGVAVMARPPGKRVTSIHLLSGGEKALTAVALVFAFFQLRPSPFCMLDEVDAPLDDANVSRFAKLVSEMSSQVQFIFITHNKVTMEMSTHLMGVTMQEPGVSRLVSVDVEEAVELAVA